MAINILEKISQIFKYTPQVADKIKEPLQFIQLMGTEKTYGKPQPNDYRAMVDQYKSWSYACAWKNATAVAKCNIKLYVPTYDNKKEKKDKKEIDQHPFLDLIKSVNPFSNKFELMTITTINLELTGNAYWYLPKGPLGIPEMIWNIPSHWVKIVPSKENFIDGYVVTVPNRPTPIPFDESEIVHFKYPSPSDLFYGQGPLWASRLSVDLGNQMKEWGVNFFLNNAQPSGALVSKAPLSADQFSRMRDQWNARHRGTKNAGKIAIFDSELTYQQIGSNIRDSRFEQVSSEIRDEILAIFGVPASKLGLESHDNRATAEASDYTYQNETILPRLTLIQEKINEKIIPIYDPRLIMQFENPVGEDREYLLKERQINLSSGFSSIDELRIEQGLDPYNLPETKVPLISFGMNPAGQPKPEPTGMFESTDNSDGKDDNKKTQVLTKVQREAQWDKFAKVSYPLETAMKDMMRRYFQKQHSEVSKKLNNFKAITKDVYGSIMFNMNEANTNLRNLSLSYIEKAYISGLVLGMEQTKFNLDMSLYRQNVLRAVVDRTNFFVEKTNETTARLLANELLAGVESGESISDIARRVDKVFNYSEDYRAKRTAQTEVVGSINEGQLALFDKAGVKEKMWLTAGDEKVRESHQIDGQIVGITESFVTNDGNYLLFPGDRKSGAPPSDTINCRCNISPVIKVD